MLEAVVPEESAGPSGYLLYPLDHKPYHLVKVPKKLEPNAGTYVLPVFTFLGLISARLNAAKKSSQGAASYE